MKYDQGSKKCFEIVPFFQWASKFQAGAWYTKSIASLELRRKEHNNDPYSLHNNTIDFTQ